MRSAAVRHHPRLNDNGPQSTRGGRILENRSICSLEFTRRVVEIAQTEVIGARRVWKKA